MSLVGEKLVVARAVRTAVDQAIAAAVSEQLGYSDPAPLDGSLNLTGVDLVAMSPAEAANLHLG